MSKQLSIPWINLGRTWTFKIMMMMVVVMVMIMMIMKIFKIMLKIEIWHGGGSGTKSPHKQAVAIFIGFESSDSSHVVEFYS